MSSYQYKERSTDDSVQRDSEIAQKENQVIRPREHGLVWRWRWWIILVLLLLVLYYVYTRQNSPDSYLMQLSPKIGPNEIDIRTDNAVQEFRKMFR